MPQVMLRVGGRRYDLACRAGEEAHFERLAALVDAKAIEAGRAVGGGNEARQLLLAALLLADDLMEMRAGAAPPADAATADSANALAARIEKLAAALEKDAAAS